MKALRCAAILALSILGIGSAVFGLGGVRSAAAGSEADVCYGYEATITGSGTIKGTNGPDVIVGSDGDDVIKGNGGDDIICGLGGDDTINGNSGDDSIFGETYYCEGEGGTDTLKGDSGDDWLHDWCGIDNSGDGGSGSDYVDIVGTANGGSGNDSAVYAYGDYYDLCGGCFSGFALGSGGHDGDVYAEGGVADGGSGNDFVYVGAEGDEARGGSGNDEVSDYNGNAVTLNGGSGRDRCYSSDDDVLISCETSGPI